MSWVTIVWSMMAAACLTLAGMHLLIGCRQRKAWGNVLFALVAVAVAGMAACELWMMRAGSPSEWGAVGRWIHVPAYVMMLSLVGFVRVYLRAGWLWLAWAVVGVRSLALVLNFVFSPNLNYREITSLRHIRFLGESVAFPVGVPNPWMLLANLSLVLLVAFVVDATVTVWRRGDVRAAIQIGFNMIFFVLMGTGQAILVLWGFVQAPITPSVFFLGIVAAMAYELSRDTLRAAELARDLGESEQRMTLAAGAANLGIWIHDLQRGDVWASEEWRALFGFTKAERLDLDRFLQRLHPEDRERFRQARARAIEGGGSYEVEYRVVLPEGRLRWIASRGGVECDGAGKALRVRGVSLDITERKEVEEALRESEARFRTMANSAPVMIWMAGTDKLCTFFNKGWLDFTGRTPEQELGNGWAEGVHPDDFDRCFETYSKAFDARERFVMEYRLRCHTGGYCWVLDNGVPRFASDGAFLGYIGSAIDISAVKLAESEAAQQRNELAHLTRVTTLSELSGSLAHELNQPLAIILSNAQAAQRLIAQSPPNLAEVSDILADIVSEDRRAGEVIKRLRTLLKRGEIAFAPLSLNETIEEVLHLAHVDLTARGVGIDRVLLAELPRVDGDRVQLQQVVLNLVLNAADAMSANAPGSRRMQLRTACRNGSVRLSVRDEGCGLPADAESIFAPFFTTKPHGLGLGLSICRSIVAAHRGRLWAEPHSERGAVFHLELPANAA